MEKSRNSQLSTTPGMSTKNTRVNGKKSDTSSGQPCAVVGCLPDMRGNKSVRFPDDPDKQMLWKQLCGRPPDFYVSIRGKTRVCYRHFPEQVQHTMRCRMQGLNNGPRACQCSILSIDPDCVPSLNLPRQDLVDKYLKSLTVKIEPMSIVETKMNEEDTTIHHHSYREPWQEMHREEVPRQAPQLPASGEFVLVDVEDLKADRGSDMDESEMESDSEPECRDNSNKDPDYVPYSNAVPVVAIKPPVQELRPKPFVSLDPMEGLCRICAQPHDDLVPVFGDEGRQLNLELKINLCLPINICEDDALPLSICRSCLQCLDTTHNFVNMSQQADEALMDVLSIHEMTTSSSMKIVVKLRAALAKKMARPTKPEVPPPPITLSPSPPDNMIHCEHCKNSFSDKEDLETHLIRKHKVRCKLCNFYSIGADIRVLDQHFIDKHINKTVECHVKSKNSKNKHKNTPKKVNIQSRNPNTVFDEKIVMDSLVCKLCSNYYKHKIELGNHYQLKHDLHICDKSTCYEMFHSQSEMQEHYRLHGNATLKLCPFCGTCFKSNSILEQHMYYDHNETQYDVSDNSHKITSSHRTRAKTRSVTVKELRCHVCEKTFSNKRDIVSHIKNSHRTDKFKCKLCSRFFITREKMQMHREKIHVKEWIYHCAICESPFKNCQAVKQHFKTHCQKDQKAFQTDQFYKTSKHQCQICFQFFQNKFKFNKHFIPLHGISEAEYYSDVQM